MMRFQFYRLAAGVENQPVLQPFGHEFEQVAIQSIKDLSDEARTAVEARFQMLSKNRQPDEAGQIVLFASKLGDPPGVIVAAELVETFPRSTRKLQWTWGESASRNIG
jgi:hypothetical protein